MSFIFVRINNFENNLSINFPFEEQFLSKSGMSGYWEVG